MIPKKQPQNELSQSQVLPSLPPVCTCDLCNMGIINQAPPSFSAIHLHLHLPPPKPRHSPTFFPLPLTASSHPAGLPFLVIETSAVQPYRRGFYCDDESIKYPAKSGDTISDGVLSAAGILITILAVSCLTLITNAVVTVSAAFTVTRSL